MVTGAFSRKWFFASFKWGSREGGSRVTLGKNELKLGYGNWQGNSYEQFWVVFKFSAALWDELLIFLRNFLTRRIQIIIPHLRTILEMWKPLRIARMNFLVNFHTPVLIHFFQSYSATPLSRPSFERGKKSFFWSRRPWPRFLIFFIKSCILSHLQSLPVISSCLKSILTTC